MSDQKPETNEDRPPSFVDAAQDEPPGLIAEFIEFLMESKKWWLTPIVVVLVVVGLLVLNSTVIAPFIYPLF